MPGQVALGLMVNPPRPGDTSYPLYKREKQGLIASLQRRARLITDAFNSLEDVECKDTNGKDHSLADVLLASYFMGTISNETMNNVFSSENVNTEDKEGSISNDGSLSQVWVAAVGLDINDRINFSVQATPDRDDIPPLGILTLEASPYLELLSSFDSDGDWKSQIQLFYRY